MLTHSDFLKCSFIDAQDSRTHGIFQVQMLRKNTNRLVWKLFFPVFLRIAVYGQDR